uniref:Uncharacterized protein n=1 Tax=Romanomermis culicivorax TaxID=13658 RepID=A0A915HTC3_ROMCU
MAAVLGHQNRPEAPVYPPSVITLTFPVVLGVVDGFKVTSIAYFGGGGSKAGVCASAETITAAKNPILITQTG